MLRWMGLWIAGCAGVVAPPLVGSNPSAFECPNGSTPSTTAPGSGTLRVLQETEVHTCLDALGAAQGPHLERWQDGAVAVEGSWRDGEPDGDWTRWFEDGAFRSRIAWRTGIQHGERLELAKDGRIVEIEMVDGAATGMHALSAGTAMPEWEAGKRIEGTAYRRHAAVTP